MSALQPLPGSALRWRCDPASLSFETTRDVTPIPGVVGQDTALDALRFGIEFHAPGQNIFIRGLAGTGRMTMVRRLLEEMRPACPVKKDRVFVHHFAEPDRPRLISLPAGTAHRFRRRVVELAEFVRDGLMSAVDSDPVKAQRESLDDMLREQLRSVTEPFEQELRENELALVNVQVGPAAHTLLAPLIDGKAVSPDQLEAMRAAGQITDEDFAGYEAKAESFQKKLADVSDKLRAIRRRHTDSVHSVVEGTVRAILWDMAHPITKEFDDDSVREFLSEVIEDVAESLGHERRSDPLEAYGVNVVLEHEPGDDCPIVIENTPTMMNLLGIVDREWGPQGPGRSDYRMIRAGSLLQADGGYLVLEAREVLREPGAWKVLMRTLRTRQLEIVPTEHQWPGMVASLKPEPIPVSIKVILLGDRGLYYVLDENDPDFSELFKVLVDFDTEIDRDPSGPALYAGVVARICADEKLPPFDRTGVAALAEHGARVVARAGKLTARFGRVADIAREAAYLSQHDVTAATVTGGHVEEAIERGKRRADLPSRRFRSMLANGTLQVQTQGEVAGQINGLAVISAGPLKYGFPARITASIGAGSAGIIDIESRAQLSGAIHTKGFNILNGLLRNLLNTDHPLAFSASIAFEQSYGGIDGDSASGAEICCLLSALTDVPIRQSLAMTGAIDQKGHIQAIGGVNEKIEGYFDTCNDFGLTGSQGVIIPHSNAGDLMLRQDVVDACDRGEFHVWAVRRVHEALEILTGVPAGELDEFGEYDSDTLLGHAVQQAGEYWLKSSARPTFDLVTDDDEEEDEEAAPASDEQTE